MPCPRGGAKGAGGRVFRYYGAKPAVGKPSLGLAPYRYTPSRGLRSGLG